MHSLCPLASLSLSMAHLSVFPKVRASVSCFLPNLLGEIVFPTSVTTLVPVTPQPPSPAQVFLPGLSFVFLTLRCPGNSNGLSQKRHVCLLVLPVLPVFVPSFTAGTQPGCTGGDTPSQSQPCQHPFNALLTKHLGNQVGGGE